MADTTDQNSDRQEDMMARGPVSRGASNKTAPTNQQQGTTPPPDSTASNQDNPPDYNRIIQHQPTGTSVGGSAATTEGLGTVGGGTIPGSSMESGTSTGGMGISNSTIAGGGTISSGVAGAGSPRERGSVTDSDLNTSTNTINAIDRTAQSNIGGRNPGQPQTAMGDTPQADTGSNASRTEPMSSRMPDENNSATEQGS